MSQADSILLKALDNIIKFLLKTVVDFTNEEIKKKIFYLNHLIEEERSSIFEKADKLLEFSEKLIEKKENVFESSNKHHSYLGNNENCNDLLAFSHTPFLSQTETESYFSKPYIKSNQTSSENLLEQNKAPMNFFAEHGKIETKKINVFFHNCFDFFVFLRELKSF